MYALEHNDACSVMVNKVDQDSESMPWSRCLSQEGESLLTFRSNITYAFFILFIGNFQQLLKDQ